LQPGDLDGITSGTDLHYNMPHPVHYDMPHPVHYDMTSVSASVEAEWQDQNQIKFKSSQLF